MTVSIQHTLGPGAGFYSDSDEHMGTVYADFLHSQTVLPCFKDTLLAMNDMPSSTSKQDGAPGPASSCPHLCHAALGGHTA